MGVINLLTARRGVQRKIVVESLRNQPELTSTAVLDEFTSSTALVIGVEFQLRNPQAHYVTGCPKLDASIESLTGKPVKLTIAVRPRRWERRPKFNHILDLTQPTMVITTAQGSREMGKTSAIEVLSAQIDTGRNPVIWLRW